MYNARASRFPDRGTSRIETIDRLDRDDKSYLHELDDGTDNAPTDNERATYATFRAVNSAGTVTG